MKENSRLYFLDYSRCLAMFLVIFAHCFVNNSTVRLYIYAFHMPFFFMVSGMLHKVGKQNLKRLLYPTVFFILLFIVVALPLYQFNIWNYDELYLHEKPITWLDTLCSSIKWTVINLVVGGKFANYYCWFLLVLCGCKLLMELYSNLKTKVPIICLIGCFGLLWGIAMWFHIHYLWIANILMAFPFYYLGFNYKSLINRFINWRFHYLLFPILLILTISLTIINGRVSMMGSTYGETPYYISPILFYINGIVGSFMLFSISPSLEIPLCTKLSKALISILGLQGIFIPFFYGRISILVGIFVSIIILFVCYILHVILQRYLPFIYQKTNLR